MWNYQLVIFNLFVFFKKKLMVSQRTHDPSVAHPSEKVYKALSSPWQPRACPVMNKLCTWSKLEVGASAIGEMRRWHTRMQMMLPACRQGLTTIPECISQLNSTTTWNLCGAQNFRLMGSTATFRPLTMPTRSIALSRTSHSHLPPLSLQAPDAPLPVLDSQTLLYQTDPPSLSHIIHFM